MTSLLMPSAMKNGQTPRYEMRLFTTELSSQFQRMLQLVRLTYRENSSTTAAAAALYLTSAVPPVRVAASTRQMHLRRVYI